MSIPLCHNCKYSAYLILLKSGVTRCPRCNCTFGNEALPIPTKLRSRIIIPAKIDMHSSLSIISAQLIARYIGQGMTTAEVAKQLGITKATVYAKLRKHGLIRPAISEDSTIHFTASDIYSAGRLKKNKNQNSVTDKPAAVKNSVTAELANISQNEKNRVTQKGDRNV